MGTGDLKQMESQIAHEKKQPQHGTGFLKTCFNGINYLTGLGLLSIPYALAQGGMLSIILLFLAAIIFWYTSLLIQHCIESDPDSEVKSYPDIGELAFGYKGRVIVYLVVYLELYLVAIELLILEGDNLAKLFPNMGFKIGSTNVGAKQCYILLTSLLILPTVWLRSLGWLAYISFGGLLTSVVLVVSVFWVGAFEGVGFHEKGVIWNWSGVPTAISIFCFCYCFHASVPTLSHSMKNKREYPKVMVVSFIVSTISYGSMAIIGYLMYGQEVKSQVTLNLPTNKVGSKIAIYTTLISPLTKYAIIVAPIASAIEDKLSCSSNRLMSIIVRTSLVASTVVIALILPFFGYLMAFTGAFLSITDSVLLPCLCYLKIKRPHQKHGFGFKPILIILIVIVGGFVAILGTYTSVISIVKELRKK